MSATRAIRPPLLSGMVTLDAQGSSDAEFIFQAGSTLIAESNSRVAPSRGAPSTPSTPPSLARTGVQILGLMGASLALPALGVSAALNGRRSGKRQVAS